jgi:hypothetical protein
MVKRSLAREDRAHAAAGRQLTPAEREAAWTVWVRFGIEASTAEEAQAIAESVFAQMDATVAGKPEVVPFPEGYWTVKADIDLTVLPSIEPDDARTRLIFLAGGLDEGVTWNSRESERQGKWDWPPDFWSKRPGSDDVLVHPAIRAAILWASAEAESA